MAEVEHARRSRPRRRRGAALPLRERRVDGAAAHEREGALHEEHPVAYAEKTWCGRGRRANKARKDE